jgi:peroxiredoxin
MQIDDTILIDTIMKTKVYLYVLISLFLMGIFPFAISGQSVGEMAPDFTLNTDGGSAFKLSDQYGTVVFIFFFGYACPHCLANGNNTETLINERFKSNVDFVAVGVDTWDGNESGVASFKTSTHITYPLCLMGSSLESEYQTTYDRIVVIDQDGVIRFKSTANSTSGVVSQAADVIADLLGSGSPSGILDTKQDDEFSWSVYPVPAGDRVFVKFPEGSVSDGFLRIIGTNGQILAEKDVPFNSGENTVELSTLFLPDGFYLLQYFGGGSIYSRNLLVDRNSKS